MKETKLVVFTEEKYMNNKPVVQLVHSTDYGIKTLRLWIDGGMTIGADKVQDDERDVYLNHFGSEAARNKAIDIWYGARHENARTPEPKPTVHHTLLKDGNSSKVLAHNECNMLDIIDFASGSGKLYFITLEKDGDKQTQVYKENKEGTRAIATVALLNKFMTEANHVNELMTMNLDEWNTGEPVVTRRHGKSTKDELEDTETKLGKCKNKAKARVIKLALCKKSNYRLEIENAKLKKIVIMMKEDIERDGMSWK